MSLESLISRISRPLSSRLQNLRPLSSRLRSFTPQRGKEIYGEESGSISPLIIFYFSIIMFLIFIISNVASMYVARRDLTTRVEAGLALAAQELDEFRYYYGSPLKDYLAERAVREGQLRVPIDCGDAGIKFGSVMNRNRTEFFAGDVERSAAGPITIDFICDGYEVGARVTEQRELPFQLRALGMTHFVNKVSAATSSYLLDK